MGTGFQTTIINMYHDWNESISKNKSKTIQFNKRYLKWIKCIWENDDSNEKD